MNCNDVNKLLNLYIDNMLEPTQMNSITEHLSHCDVCKQKYEELTEILSLLANIEDAPIPEEFDRRLRIEIEKEAVQMKNTKTTPLSKGIWRDWRRLSSIAAVFVVGLFSVLLYNNLDTFIQYDSQDTNTVKTLSESSLEDANKGLKTLQKEENPEMINEDAAFGVKPDLEPPLTNSTINSNQNIEPEIIKSNDPSDEIPQMAVRSDTLGKDVTEDNTERLEESLLEESNSNMNFNNLETEFNPSIFIQSLSEEDAQIYTELMNVHTSLSSEKDSIALINYVKQVKTLLAERKYELISCKQEPEGQWNITIFVTSIGKNGEEIKQRVTYCGQDGKVWEKELLLLTETV